MKHTLLIVFCLIVCLVSPSWHNAQAAAPSLDLLFPAVSDTRVTELAPEQNFGGEPHLRVDGGSDPDVQSFVRFQVSDVVGSVHTARLMIYALTNTTAQTELYRTTGNWSEGETRWNNRPNRGALVAQAAAPAAPGMWMSFVLDGIITGNGTYDFVLASSSTDGLTMSSREGQQPPRLVLTLDPVLLAAGDIASCDSGADKATSAVLDGQPGTVATLGDTVYDSGTAAEFANCYDPAWGRHKYRTRPAIGNHEYETPGAAPYFDYFGSLAGERGRGYYSYDLGAWHIIVLNSNCTEIDCQTGSPQEQWLRADLAAHPARCTLAYFHHPRFSSGRYGTDPAVRPFWQALYEAGADIVLSGHEHHYERFAPQDPDSNADPERGLRLFIVGTGGKTLRPIPGQATNSEVRQAHAYGVLRLQLAAKGGYSWQFLAADGADFVDSGKDRCH